MFPRPAWLAICLGGLLACGGAPPPESGGPPLVVSAAMSLRLVMLDIGRAWEASGAGRAAFNVGPSNSLARQIAEGGPVDVFVSADEAQMDLAAQAGALIDETRVDVLGNSLVVIVPAERLRPLASARDLAGEEFRRIAVGDPEAVPVGVYARGYLESIGLWEALRPRLLTVVSVRSALGAVESGGADAAFVYRTDARLSSHVAVAFEVPEGAGPAIRYPAAVVRSTRQPDAARRFLAFLQGDEARRIFEDQGFRVLPAPAAAR